MFAATIINALEKPAIYLGHFGQGLMNSKKFIMKSILLALAVFLLSPVVAAAFGYSLSRTLVPYITLAAGVFMALVFWYIFDGHSGEATGQSGRNQLLQEVSALNHHAMVSLTDRDARLFHVNDKLLEVSGFNAEDLLGQSTSVLYAEEDKHQFAGIRAGLDRGIPWTGETRMRCKSGKTIWTQATILPRLDSEGHLIGTVSIRTDVTTAKINAQQNDLFTTLHKLWDEVYMLDPETLAFSYMNEAALARVGWEAGEVKTKTLWDDCKDLDEAKFRARIEPLLTGEVDQITYADDIDGVPYNNRIQLITTYSGEKQLVAVLRDASEQAEVERVKAELLATISHELRTPMTSIKGAMGLLLSNAAGELPEKARTMLSIAYRNSDRLVMIINDILDIEKIAAGQMVFEMNTMPLSLVIDESIAANEQFANRFDVTVEKQGVDEAAHASYDFGRTLQVLTNLLSNAAKFSPVGSKVIVRMEQIGQSYRISVQDFGTGIPEEAQGRIFERFTQVKQDKSHRGVQGTGLGLNISKVIMEQQSGGIGMVSQEGVGSTFFVEFPVAEVNDSLQDQPAEIAS
jgi:PAS domain S-box-containing protein